MLEEIKRFYDKVKNRKEEMPSENNDKPPISFTHIFHKEYPRFQSIKLPEIKLNRNTENLFEKRKSNREFKKQPLTLEELSIALTSSKILEKDGEFERRTYPSAGARFPVELYPIIFNVEDLEPGAYHYNILDRSLELLWEKDFKEIEKEIVSPYIENCSVAIIMTSAIARSEIKYRHKAYPFSLIEAGHIGQNLSLICAEQDLGCCAIGGYIDGTLDKILDLTENEIPIYAFALGKIEKK